MKNIYIYCREHNTIKAIFVLKTTVTVDRGSSNEMTGKQKKKKEKRKRAGNKLKALVEKEITGSYHSNNIVQTPLFKGGGVKGGRSKFQLPPQEKGGESEKLKKGVELFPI